MAGTHIVATALVAAMTAPGLPLRQELAWSELTERLERAALAGSGRELRAVRIDLLRQLMRPAEQAPAQSLLEYAIAYVGYRLANLGDVPEQEQADLVDDAVERLEALVNDDPKYTEAHALLGSLYGLQIGRDASRGVVLGVRASGALDRAEAAAPTTRASRSFRVSARSTSRPGSAVASTEQSGCCAAASISSRASLWTSRGPTGDGSTPTSGLARHSPDGTTPRAPVPSTMRLCHWHPIRGG